MGKVFRKILSVPYSIYVYFIYFHSAIIVFIISFIISFIYPKEKAGYQFQKVLKIWSDTWMFLSGIRIRYIGRENYRRDRSYVMVSNHYSLLDMMTGASAVWPNIKALAKIEIKKVPVFNRLFVMGSVFVDRKSKEGREKSKRELAETLKSGKSIWIYAEGTRNKTDKPLKEFYDGAFKIAIEQGAPVLPTITLNSRFVVSGKSFWMWPGRYEVMFLPAIETTGMTEEDVPALKDRVYTLMEGTILRYDKWFGGKRPE